MNFITLRATFIEYLFYAASKVYLKFKLYQQPWRVQQHELKSYPQGSLGQALFHFLEEHHYTLQALAETHDVFHVLVGIPTTVKDEIGLQYLLLGNGKRSPFLVLAVLTGLLLMPDKLSFFIKQYHKGRSIIPFHHLDFEALLTTSLISLQNQYKLIV